MTQVLGEDSLRDCHPVVITIRKDVLKNRNCAERTVVFRNMSDQSFYATHHSQLFSHLFVCLEHLPLCTDLDGFYSERTMPLPEEDEQFFSTPPSPGVLSFGEITWLYDKSKLITSFWGPCSALVSWGVKVSTAHKKRPFGPNTYWEHKTNISHLLWTGKSIWQSVGRLCLFHECTPT